MLSGSIVKSAGCPHCRFCYRFSFPFFTVNELLVDVEAGTVTRPLKRVKTMTIGFPVGHSVNEVITFIASTGKLSEIRAIRSPSGAETDVSTVIIN